MGFPPVTHGMLRLSDTKGFWIRYNMNMRNILTSLLLFFGAALFMIPSSAQAISVYFDPVVKDVHLGDTFVLNLRINNEDECVNAADITIEYDNSVMSAVDVGRGESLITLWIEPPIIDNAAGTITFSGGIPGGYCGRIVGDPGLSNLLAKLVFSTSGLNLNPSVGDVGEVVVGERSQILLNDGFGTQASFNTSTSTITILERRSFVLNEWVDEIQNDTIPPEAFTVELHRDPAIEGDKYFITFSTNDKQSGIDHFEVFESSLSNPGYEEKTQKPAQWRVIENNEQYYVLRDQTLKSKVIVKAVDKAGNEQIAELGDDSGGTALLQTFGTLEKALMGIIGIGSLVIVLGVVLFFRKRKRKEVEIVYEQE